MKWYAQRDKHPSAGYAFDAHNLSEEERLEHQLALEAECNGVESGGYVAAEALNEHPSALPSFDRRLWSADPFYAWRTQEELREEASAPVPRLRDGFVQPQPELSAPLAEPPVTERSTGPIQEPVSWFQWFQPAEPKRPEPPPRPAPAPLPSSSSLAPRWEKEAATAAPPPIPPSARQRLPPEPSPAELRDLLEPELLAAGLSWEEVDEQLWSELRSVGELRRAAAQPHTFPRRLGALSAPLGRRMAAAEVRHFLEPELAKYGITWQDLLGGAQPPLDALSAAELEDCPRHPEVLARRIAEAAGVVGPPPEPAEAPQLSLSLPNPREAAMSLLPAPELPALPTPPDFDLQRVQGPPEMLPDKAPANRTSSKAELPSEETQKSKKEKRREKKEKKDKKSKNEDGCSTM